MTHRSAVRFAVVCFALYTLAVHWPGILPFAGVRPFVLGLPFNFFWIVLWVVLGGVALAAVELTRGRDAAESQAAESDAVQGDAAESHATASDAVQDEAARAHAAAMAAARKKAARAEAAGNDASSADDRAGGARPGRAGERHLHDPPEGA